MISTLLFFLCFFISGVTLFSGLFLFTDNYDPVEQLLKPLVAAFHCMVMIIPVFMAQSRFLLFRIVGYGLVVLFFLYSIFMTGFFSYFGFLPDPFAFGAANVADAIEVVDHYFDQVFGIREIVFIVVGVITLVLIPRLYC